MRLQIALGLALAGTVAFAADGGLDVPQFAEGEVTRADGLAAWERVHEVLTHPRCLNCHVGEDNVPLWQDTSDDLARAHGMNINAGDSRIGVEYLQCSTCHVTSTRPNDVPNAAPHTGMDWQLAPVEFVWVGRSPQEICEQVRDPERNGGRDGAGLVEHITHDAEVQGFITWAFAPGVGREAAPFGLQQHLNDTAAWAAAGLPCPGDG